MNKIVIIIIVIIIVIILCWFFTPQKEGFWGWNYWNGSPCVEDAFGNVICDPAFNYLYPNYFYYPNPFLYTTPNVMYRRIQRY